MSLDNLTGITVTKFRIRTNVRFRDIKETSIFGKLEFIPKIFKIHNQYYFTIASIITWVSCPNLIFVGAAVSEISRGQTHKQTNTQTNILDIYPCILPLLFRCVTRLINKVFAWSKSYYIYHTQVDWKKRVW